MNSIRSRDASCFCCTKRACDIESQGIAESTTSSRKPRTKIDLNFQSMRMMKNLRLTSPCNGAGCGKRESDECSPIACGHRVCSAASKPVLAVGIIEYNNAPPERY